MSTSRSPLRPSSPERDKKKGGARKKQRKKRKKKKSGKKIHFDDEPGSDEDDYGDEDNDDVHSVDHDDEEFEEEFQGYKEIAAHDLEHATLDVDTCVGVGRLRDVAAESSRLMCESELNRLYDLCTLEVIHAEKRRESVLIQAGMRTRKASLIGDDQDSDAETAALMLQRAKSEITDRILRLQQEKVSIEKHCENVS